VLVSAVAKPDQERADRRGVRALFMLVNVTTAALSEIARRIDAGHLRTRVGEILPLDQAGRAHRMLEAAPARQDRAEGNRLTAASRVDPRRAPSVAAARPTCCPGDGEVALEGLWTNTDPPRSRTLRREAARGLPGGMSDGLPVGMQVIGRRNADADVLAASAAFERLRPWRDSYRLC
jgi:Asp-tRNA(Asn)/Glu-tRNA(Gln) amidotransferase A subunit family amidase